VKTSLKLVIAAILIVTLQPPHGALAGNGGEEDIVVGTRYTIDSEALGELREILVSVPDDRSRSYPVIYVLNADAEFLSTVATVRHLATNANRMPDFIVVGVVPINGAKETRPNFPWDGSRNEHEALFRQFIAKELVAHVDSTYNTHPFRILVGHSLSGLFTLNTFRSEADLFDAYFAFSPALWWDSGAEADAIQQSIAAKRTDAKTVVVTVANEGDESLSLHRSFVDGWQNASTSKSALFETEFPEESHSSTTLPAINWSLQQLFAGWRPEAYVYQMGLAGLSEHYSSLSERFGWAIEIPSDDLSPLIFEFARRGNEGDDLRAYELIEHAVARDPGMYDELIEMIGALEIQGHANGAAIAKQALCNSDPSQPICSN
jgi:predicted alpha/beta superfamily hydrolase